MAMLNSQRVYIYIQWTFQDPKMEVRLVITIFLAIICGDIP